MHTDIDCGGGYYECYQCAEVLRRPPVHPQLYCDSGTNILYTIATILRSSTGQDATCEMISCSTGGVRADLWRSHGCFQLDSYPPNHEYRPCVKGKGCQGKAPASTSTDVTSAEVDTHRVGGRDWASKRSAKGPQEKKRRASVLQGS